MKNSLTWSVKSEILHFRKSKGINKRSFENCTGMERSSREPFYSRLQVIESSRQYLLL